MPGESAGARALAPAVDGDSFDGVALLNIVHIFQEIQVQGEAVWGLHRIRGLSFEAIFRRFEGRAIS